MAFISVGGIGGKNPLWINEELQFIKDKLRSKKWNERRFAALAIGSIGSAEPSLVKEVIPILVEYVADIESVRDDL